MISNSSIWFPNCPLKKKQNQKPVLSYKNNLLSSSRQYIFYLCYILSIVCGGTVEKVLVCLLLMAAPSTGWKVRRVRAAPPHGRAGMCSMRERTPAWSRRRRDRLGEGSKQSQWHSPACLFPTAKEGIEGRSQRRASWAGTKMGRKNPYKIKFLHK